MRNIGVFAIVVMTLLNSYLLILGNGHSPGSGNIATYSQEVEHSDICPEGGQEIFVGMDTNNNRVLDIEERQTATILCHGPQGQAGSQGLRGSAGLDAPSFLLDSFSVNVANQTCPHGGVGFNSGSDSNLNGVLDLDEIVDTALLCHGSLGVAGSDGQDGVDGSKGHSALVEQHIPPSWLCSDGISLAFGVDDGQDEGIADDGILQDHEIRAELKMCFDRAEPQRATDIAAGISDSFSANCEEVIAIEASEFIVFSATDSNTGCELYRYSLSTGISTLIFDLHSSGDSQPGRMTGFFQAHHDQQTWLYFDADTGTGASMWAMNTSEWIPAPLIDVVVRSPLMWNQEVLMWNESNQLVVIDGVQQVPMWQASSIDEESMLESTLRDNYTHLGEMYANSFDDLVIMSAMNSQGQSVILAVDDTLTEWIIPSPQPISITTSIRTTNGIVAVASVGDDHQLILLHEDGSFLWLTQLTYDGGDGLVRHLGHDLGLHLVDNNIVFDAITEGVDSTLWSVDLDTFEVSRLSDQLFAVGQETGGHLINEMLYFDCINATTGREVCQTDGTVDHTLVQDALRPGIQGSDPQAMVSFGHHLFILADGVEDGQLNPSTLWIFDGSTFEFGYDAYPGAMNDSQSGTYGQLIALNSHLMWIGHDGSFGHELLTWNMIQFDDTWVVV